MLAEPPDITDAPLSGAHRTSLLFFLGLRERPEASAAFNNYIIGHRSAWPHWPDGGFVALDQLAANFDQNISPVRLVDVRSGLGHEPDRAEREAGPFSHFPQQTQSAGSSNRPFFDDITIDTL